MVCLYYASPEMDLATSCFRAIMYLSRFLVRVGNTNPDDRLSLCGDHTTNNLNKWHKITNLYHLMRVAIAVGNEGGGGMRRLRSLCEQWSENSS